MASKRGLGRNLNDLGVQELLSKLQTTQAAGSKVAQDTTTAPTHVETLPIDCVQPGRYQPRVQFAEEALEELAASIQQHGVIQPILVRPLPQAGRYEIIAGERRWRGSQRAGLTTVPAIVQRVSDDTAMAIGLIENLQREDLSIIEVAQGMQRLSDSFNFTHQQMAQLIGMSRSHVTNTLRLLHLEPDIQTMLMRRALDMGHARALLAIGDTKQRLQLARTMSEKNLSVREAERLVQRSLDTAETDTSRTTTNLQLPPALMAQWQRLAKHWDIRVRVKPTSDRAGQVSFSYKDLAQLQALFVALSQGQPSRTQRKGLQGSSKEPSLIDGSSQA